LIERGYLIDLLLMKRRKYREMPSRQSTGAMSLEKKENENEKVECEGELRMGDPGGGVHMSERGRPGVPLVTISSPMSFIKPYFDTALLGDDFPGSLLFGHAS
jgi:hypothetical protein